MPAVRVLLLQARRDDDPVREEERRSFARHAGLAPEQIVAHDLLAEPASIERIRRFDALMIGGSGEFYVSKRDLPGQEELFTTLRQVAELGFPTFASCFGFHCLVEALGGEIIHDPENVEVGTHRVGLTAAAAADPLIGTLPASFFAQMGRKDRAARLPDGVVNLAESDRCPLQAFRLPRQPIWATQFHPELDEATNRGRYLRYLDGYAELLDERQREAALASFRPSPETAPLLGRFLELVVG